MIRQKNLSNPDHAISKPNKPARPNRPARLVAALLALLALLTLLAPAGAYAEEAAAPSEAANLNALTAGIEVEGDQAYIYVSNGPEKKRIVSDSAKALDARYAAQVNLSPDGQKVLFVSAANPGSGEVTIWKVNRDGSGRQALATMPAARLWTAPFAWSADSARLAYVLAGPEGRLELWKMQAGGSDQEKVLDQNETFRPEIFYGQDNKALGWSADGRFLTYTDRTGNPNQQYFLNLETKALTSVVISARPAGDRQRLEVPLFSQKDPRWGGDGIGCGTTLASQGCAVTSVAMVFRYYGVDTDPKQLRNCLGGGACPLDWSGAVSRCSQGKVTGGAIERFDVGRMEQALKQGYPVIVGLAVNTGANHFVVVTAGSGPDPAGYVVNDPWDATSNKTLQHFIDILGWPNQMNIFVGAPPAILTTGLGSSRQASFMEAYNRSGGAAGQPVNPAHWWFGTVIQDFSGDPAAIIQDEDGENRQGLKAGTCQAFSVHRGIFNWYQANGNPAVFGPATSDEYAVAGGQQQSFGKGYIRSGDPSSFTPWPQSGTGWRQEFYNNPAWGCGPAWVGYQSDLNLGYDWSASSPHPAVFKSGWSARFSRTEQFPGGQYQVSIESGNDVRLWIDGNLVISLQGGQGNGRWTGNLNQGQHSLKLEYRSGSGQPRLAFTLNPLSGLAR